MSRWNIFYRCYYQSWKIIYETVGTVINSDHSLSKVKRRSSLMEQLLRKNQEPWPNMFQPSLYREINLTAPFSTLPPIWHSFHRKSRNVDILKTMKWKYFNQVNDVQIWKLLSLDKTTNLRNCVIFISEFQMISKHSFINPKWQLNWYLNDSFFSASLSVSKINVLSILLD